MKFSVERDSLIQAIQTVQSVVSGRSSLPILNNILIKGSSTGLEFIATDLDTGIKTTLPVNLQEEGSISLPAKHLYEIVKELPEAVINFQVKKNNSVIIDCGASHFKLLGLPSDDFPKVADLKDTHSIVLKQATLKEIIVRSSFSMSHDETRYILNGVLFSLKSKVLKLVATDGRRLALLKYDIGEDNKITKDIIVPAKAIQELNRTLGEEGDVKIVFGANQVMFKLEKTSIITRLIEGEFPNYEQVIPKELGNKIHINRAELSQAIRRVSIFTTSESQAVKMDISSGKLVISKNSPELGEAKEEIAVGYHGGDITVGFNPYFLIDVLKNITDEEIDLEISAADKPATIRSKEYIYLVLPMQI